VAGLKDLGNACYKVGKIEEAIVYYTQAIDLGADAPDPVRPTPPLPLRDPRLSASHLLAPLSPDMAFLPPNCSMHKIKRFAHRLFMNPEKNCTNWRGKATVAECGTFRISPIA